MALAATKIEARFVTLGDRVPAADLSTLATPTSNSGLPSNLIRSAQGLISQGAAEQIVHSLKEANLRKLNDRGMLDTRGLELMPLIRAADTLSVEPTAMDLLLNFHDQVYLQAKKELGEFIDETTIERATINRLLEANVIDPSHANVQGYLNQDTFVERIRRGDINNPKVFCAEIGLGAGRASALMAFPLETVVLSTLYRPSATFVGPDQATLLNLQAIGVAAVLSILTVQHNSPEAIAANDAPNLIHAGYSIEKPNDLGAMYVPSHEYVRRQLEFDRKIFELSQAMLTVTPTD